jgi:proline-specific peptidase
VEPPPMPLFIHCERSRFVSSQVLKQGLCVTKILALIICTALYASTYPCVAAESSTLLERRDGFVDACGAIVYYESIGQGRPLMVLHGGPGVPHGYFLPYLLPLAKHHRLIFMDERGSGRSQRLADFKQYTLDAMACDADAVRRALGLKTVDVMGHSFGGILAQAYAIKYPSTIRRLILASTGSSAARVNADFKLIKESLDPVLRARIEALELKGILGEDGAQLPEYRKLADEAESSYEYVVRPPPWDDHGESFGWDALSEMWGSRSDFHIDGSLARFDFVPSLHDLQMATLIILGDHDLISVATAEETHAALRSSKVTVLARSGHMTFVDQIDAFLNDVSAFLDD